MLFFQSKTLKRDNYTVEVSVDFDRYNFVFPSSAIALVDCTRVDSRDKEHHSSY